MKHVNVWFCSWLLCCGMLLSSAQAQTPLSPSQLKVNYQQTQNQSVLTWVPRGTYRVLADISGSKSLAWSGAQVWALRNSLWKLTGFQSHRWTTSGTELYQSANAGGIWHYTPALTWRDYTFEYRVRTTSTADRDLLGLVFRYKDSKNYYYFYMCGQSGPSNCGTTRLRKVVNGVNTVLFTKDPRVDKKYGYLTNRNYVVKVITKGDRFQIFSNNVLLIDLKDATLKEGSFGTYSSSQDRTFMTNFKVTHAESEALPSATFTGSFDKSHTRLQNKTVGDLTAAAVLQWTAKFGYSNAQVKVNKYSVDVVNDPKLFEGIVSVNGIAATPTDPKAYPYGRQKAGIPQYEVYRDGTRLTPTPIKPTSYTDKYLACTIKVGSKLVYSVTTVDTANKASAQSSTVSVTYANTKPTFKKIADQQGSKNTPWTLDVSTLIDDVDAPNSTLKVTTSSSYITVAGTTLTFLYPPTVTFTTEKVTATVTDCYSEVATVIFTVTLVNRKPTFSSTPSLTATELIPYKEAVTATDPDGDKLTYLLKKGPTSATIDAKTGEVTWTPQTGDDGKSFTFEVEVCDDGNPKQCATKTWTVKVGLGNRPPEFTSKPPQDAYVGEILSYQPVATDPNSKDTLSWKLKTAVGNAKVDPTTGAFTWTPQPGDLDKPIKFDIEVCDDGTPKACTTQSFTLTPRKRCRVDTNCQATWICVANSSQQWVCLPPGCASANPQCAKASDVCRNSACIANPCLTVKCTSGSFCRPTDGKCISACAGVSCQAGETCRDGKCEKDACSTAGSACKTGEICDITDPKKPSCITDPCSASTCRHSRVCDQGYCVDDPCGRMTCPDTKTQRCVAGQCVDLQDCGVDIDCPTDQVCIGKKCRLPDCYLTANACTNQQICANATCTANECPAPGGNACKADEFCRPLSNQCAPSCGKVTCPAGQQCRDGKCENDPCANTNCSAGEVCVTGTCEKDRCSASNVCKHGRSCSASSNGCVDDPCQGITCPDASQICREGQCIFRACQFDKDCPQGQICHQQKCIKTNCQKGSDCQSGEVCQAGQCVKDPCEGVQCNNQQICRGGTCIDTCAGVFCKPTEACVDGKCVANPCDGVSCQADEICSNGKCVKDTCKGVTDACRNGRLCRVDQCTDDPCASVTCPQGQTCQGGQCTGKRTCTFDSDCPTGGICLQGSCEAPGCYDAQGCKSDELCLQGKCTADPCANKQCADREVCRPSDGTCVPSCPACGTDQICQNGVCVDDPCKDVSCQSGEVCEQGKCEKSPCKDNTQSCRYARACNSKGCNDEACTGMKCPTDTQCIAGTCVNTKGPEPIPEPQAEPIPDASEPTPEATSESVVKDSGGNNPKEIDEPLETIAAGGCRCQSNAPPAPLGILLMVVFAAFLLRRRM